ncbi:hypothetical protein NPIL_621591 [Nephila pilipes]|uniref:Uncharacterized protein n=1 Tax=Nephila pilipes TaxID=299642 RepID=A0A8X6R5E3_NEPPI|nr:hypothetical protein NPIL_621591 [Nephila pilipes]
MMQLKAVSCNAKKGTKVKGLQVLKRLAKRFGGTAQNKVAAYGGRWLTEIAKYGGFMEQLHGAAVCVEQFAFWLVGLAFAFCQPRTAKHKISAGAGAFTVAGQAEQFVFLASCACYRLFLHVGNALCLQWTETAMVLRPRSLVARPAANASPDSKGGLACADGAQPAAADNRSHGLYRGQTGEFSLTVTQEA